MGLRQQTELIYLIDIFSNILHLSLKNKIVFKTKKNQDYKIQDKYEYINKKSIIIFKTVFAENSFVAFQNFNIYYIIYTFKAFI